MARLAGMRGSIVALAVLAATGAGARDISAEPDALSGEWAGIYRCVQGQTAVVVALTLEAGGTVSGTFTFGNLPGRSNAKDGKYRLVGTFDEKAGKLTLRPDGWIDQPEGYMQVGFAADLDRDAERFIGRIEAQGCSTIVIEKSPN